MGVHVGGDLLLVGQRAERGAVELRAAVTRHQHMRDNAVAVTLERLAQRLHVGCQALLGRSGVAERGEPVDPCGRVGDRGSRRVRRTKQGLLAARGDGVAGKIVEAG